MNTYIFIMIIVFANNSPPIFEKFATQEQCAAELLEKSRDPDAGISKGFCSSVVADGVDNE